LDNVVSSIKNISLKKYFLGLALLVATATLVSAQRQAVVPYRELALEAFRENDPDASYVFVAARDASGFPAAMESEDGTRYEASRLWPAIVK
jgi:hypothetical protein